jgi:NAD(P)-dependent dehydrogenase (short-subunit alcohol dehydrogenase family)
MILDKFRLDGKTALVTGASRGIGRAIAIAYAEAGADVVLVSRNEGALRETAEAVERVGRRAMVAPAHCGQPAEIATLAERVRRECGGIDILVNNAGTNPVMGPLTSVEEAAWDKTFDVNLKGPYLLVKAFAPEMRSRGWGRIINMSSNGGVRPAAVLSTYCITKAALIAMTRVLAQELGPDGITVNAIAPGLIETRLASALTSNEEILAQALERTILRRLGQPEDIAGLAVYLASEASWLITGEVIVIDGGQA